MVNGRIQVVEYESLPIIYFNCGKYDHVSETCPNKSPKPGHAILPPPALEQPHDSVMTTFGPWMLVGKYHGDAQDIEGGLDSIHAKDDVPPSNNQKHKGKQPAAMKQLRAVHVRKPLAVTLNDFSIVPRSAYIAVISGNSDPNLQPAGMNPSVTPGSSNSLTLGEPLDSSASLFVGSSEENLRNIGHKDGCIIASLGFSYSHRIEANGFSCGIWIAWFDSIKVEDELNHFQFVHCHITSKKDGSSSLATIIYANPNATKLKALWSNLRHLSSTICSP
ncbi:hypothetical protein V6N13_030821 [Hibiscus sabdariffa]